VKFVAVDRWNEWAGKHYEPSKWALLCSAHFDESCCDSSVSLKQSMGFSPPYVKKLLPDAVLTVSGKRKSNADDIPASSLIRPVLHKLTRKRVSKFYTMK